MKVNGFIRRGVAHLLSILMILSTLSMGLAALGVVEPQEVYAAGIETVTKGQTVYLGPTSAPGAFDVKGASASQWTVLDVQDAQGNSTTDSTEAARVLMITKGVWMTYDEMTGKDLGVKYADLDTWCESFYSDVLNSDARIATVDGKHAFCLTKDQANSLFADNSARKVEADNPWWLSTPYENIATYAYCVDTSGAVIYRNQNSEYYVRPVVYLDLTKVTCSSYFKAWSIYDSHNFGSWTKKDDEKHQRTCSRDGVVEEAAHTWDDGVIADGVKTYTCSDCGSTKTEEVASEKPEILVAIDSANEQPAANGSYRWAFFGADGDIDLKDLSAEDFSMQVKVGDGDWTAATGVTVELKASEEHDGVVEATIPDNTEEVAKQWRFTYAGGILDWSYEEADCPAITQAAYEASQPAKPANVVISRGVSETEENQFQPVSGGTYVWTVQDSNYGVLEGLVDQGDFKLQMQPQTTGGEWADFDGGSISIDFPEEEEGYVAIVTATIPDNTDSYDKNWRIAYKYTEPDTQYETCGAAFYTQVALTDKTALSAAITSAQNAMEGVAVSEDGLDIEPSQKYTTAAEKKALTDAIATAQGVYYDARESQTNIDNAVITLNAAAATYEAAKKDGNKQPEPVEKPVIGDVYILSGNEQPAAGGTFSWAFFGVDDSVDWSGVTSSDFSAQVKVGEGTWTASSATVTMSTSDEYHGVVTINVPDNEEEVEKQWRFKYAGGIVDYNDEPIDCPAIKQAAAEPPALTRPALVISADDESVSSAGGEVSWFVQSYDRSDLEDVVNSSDFTVQMNAGDGWDNMADVAAVFKIGNNDDEGDVTVNVPANNEEKVKSWRLVYKGVLYAHDGEALKPADCPAITQAAKDPVAEAKTSAKSELAAYRDAKNDADYDEEGVAALNAAKEAGDSVIEAATTTDEVAAALEDAKEAIDGVMTRAQKDAATLAEAKELAREELNGIDTSKYSGDEKAAVEKAIADGLEAINNAETKEDVAAAVNAAKSAIAQQKTDEQKAAEAAAKAAEEKAKATPSVTVSGSTVTADSIAAAIAAAGGSKEYVTELVLDKSVKKISKNALKGTSIKTIIVQTKKLKKKSVKGSLKGSSVTTVKVQIGKAKTNKKYVKKYKKYFTKKNAGKKVKVKK